MLPLSGAFDKQELFDLLPRAQLGVLYTVYIFVISVKVNVNAVSKIDLLWFFASTCTS